LRLLGGRQFCRAGSEFNPTTKATSGLYGLESGANRLTLTSKLEFTEEVNLVVQYASTNAKKVEGRRKYQSDQ
jgi:hypothetical protein